MEQTVKVSSNYPKFATAYFIHSVGKSFFIILTKILFVIIEIFQ